MSNKTGFPKKNSMAKVLFVLLSLSMTGIAWASRKELELSGTGWKSWMDTSAHWSSDMLFLPDKVNLPEMPVNPPTCGWANMYDKEGISCKIPASVEELFSGGVNTWTYHGVSWFWREVVVPQEWSGETIRLVFEKTRMRTEAYIDGKLAGYDLIAETPWETDITDYLTYGVNNKLAVRITNPGGQRGWEDYGFIAWGNYEFPASHDFGGIGGKVTLVCTDNTYIDNVFVKNKLPALARNLDIITVLNNKDEQKSLVLRVEIYPYPTGADVYSNSWDITANARGTTIIEKSICVPSAGLWDIDDPVLYCCKASISGSGVDDSMTERFGFRVFEARETNGRDNLYFNGKRIRHRSAIDWGFYAMTGFYPTPEMAQKSVQAAKEIGHNGINLHRQIGELLVFKYADELGLYLYEEPGGMHICQGYEVIPGTFAGDILEYKCKRMVVRDRNHPSLIWYNLCNEDDCWNALRKRTMGYFRDLDGTRLVTNASAWSEYTNHIRPYETKIRKDFDDYHTVDSLGRFQESIFSSHVTDVYDRIKYWGEVACYTGPANWYSVAEKAAGTTGYDKNVYQPLHDKILQYFNKNRLDRTGSKNIPTPGDVTIQAGRGLMYTDGRLGQRIMCSDSEDGYAINGWSSGPQGNGPEGTGESDWDSAIVDEGRNLKGPAGDFLYWVRDLQVAILRQNGKYFNAGQAALFDVYLINEGKLETGDYNLKIRVADGKGNYTAYLKEFAVRVGGGDVYAQKLTDDLAVKMEENWHGGYITIEGTLYDADGTLKTEGKEQVLLMNRPSYNADISGYEGAVHAWPAAKQAIRDAGVAASDFSPGNEKYDYIAAGNYLAKTEWKINCGDYALDGLGTDAGYSEGKTLSSGDTVTNDYGYPNAMKSYRFGEKFGYRLELPNGNYTVKLYFCEVYHNNQGQREFDVRIEDVLKLVGFDIFEQAGGHNKGIEKVFKGISVTDGVLNIEFSAKIDNALVNIIVVQYEGVTPQPATTKAILDNMLKKVYDDGTELIIKFDENWADELFRRGILSRQVTSWGGMQTSYWNGNGWGYIDYFIGDSAVPSKATIGTNGWEVPSDPYGFWPFESPYPQAAYGAHFARHDKLHVLIGEIVYGSGKILLVPCYPVDSRNAFCDLLFYNFISKTSNKHISP